MNDSHAAGRGAVAAPEEQCPPTPLDLAIAAVGSQEELARRLDVKSPSISGWRHTGIPPKRVLRIEEVTGVPRHVLRPDMYPPVDARGSDAA